MADEKIEDEGSVQEATDSENAQIEQLCSYWQALAPSYELSEAHKVRLRCLLPRFTLDEVKQAMARGIDFYVYERGETHDVAWSRIGGICMNRQVERENPELAVFRHLYNIVRKRLTDVSQNIDNSDASEEDDAGDGALELLDLAHRRGVLLKDLEIAARTAKTMEQFNKAVIERVRIATDKDQRPDVTILVKHVVANDD